MKREKWYKVIVFKDNELQTTRIKGQNIGDAFEKICKYADVERILSISLTSIHVYNIEEDS